ncbi:solute carrier family 39 (zinc transporter), member 14 [Mytilus galloprovincialis]|uniref:Solute carrier family 39 (Zinc transporter), member 14 n=1 Tax=Mytilus galloprovincialis TaxID=29158 RepID=A0A8B6C5N0_MYTGA|nr:solute carrier family 39 (zinc transporter), member 14 [Mytilus galloprovincialis]
MVGLAVGSLAANGLLVLIPEALELMHIEGIRQTYIWKCSTVVGSIYLFFVIERFLQHFVQIKKPKYKDSLALVPKIKITSSSSICADAVSMDDGSVVMGDFDLLDQLNQDEGINKNDMINSNASKSIKSDTKTVSSVAWMIIVGHGFHSFIDGLTIGAAFTESLITGISISVSIFCEELPNGLGDFAILVNSGMTGKKALMFNFLSACMCYFGLIAGTILGENTAAHEWVFAIAGGMFLYLSLVDMMPEMNSEAESEENKKNIGPLQIFLLQNFGMGVGFSVILIMAVYGGNIEF